MGQSRGKERRGVVFQTHGRKKLYEGAGRHPLGGEMMQVFIMDMDGRL